MAQTHATRRDMEASSRTASRRDSRGQIGNAPPVDVITALYNMSLDKEWICV